LKLAAFCRCGVSAASAVATTREAVTGTSPAS
jgi:hypothetical protein